MAATTALELSVVIPVYNEAPSLASFHTALLDTLNALQLSYELLYIDDGSTDDSAALVQVWHRANQHVKLISLSRNFGKENALAAGLALAAGQAIITIDSDGQHPVKYIPEFISAWQGGAQVVVGVRRNNKGIGIIKRLSSQFFYKLFNTLPGQKLLQGSTDFRLIDREVQQAFLQLKENDRITRGLIDWLGFRRALVYFQPLSRQAGKATYSSRRLMKLAADSFVSLTPTPLYLFGYLGIFITCAAFLLGSAVIIEQLLAGDPWHWRFTGTAALGILILFLVGLILISQGILSLYISHIHSQSKQRPLYIIDYKASQGIKQISLDA